MKIIFVLIILLISTSSQAQCFKELRINRYLEHKLQLRCVDFPHEINNLRTLYIESDLDITIWSEDIARFKNLSVISIESINSSRPVNVLLKDKIILPATLESLYMTYGIKKVDYSSGTFITQSAIRFEAYYQPEMKSFIDDGQFSILTLRGTKTTGLVNETIIKPTTHLNLNGFTSYVNLSIVAKSVDIRSHTDGILENAKIVSQSLYLDSLKLIGTQNLMVNGDLAFLRVESEKELDLGLSQIKNLTLSRFKGGFSSARNFDQTTLIKIEDSVIGSFSLPVEMPFLSSILIKQSLCPKFDLPLKLPFMKKIEISKADISVPRWPSMPLLERLFINQVDLESTTGALEIHPLLKFINLNETKLSELEIELFNPAKLEVVFLLGNKLGQINIINASDAKKMPAHFAMYVKSKKNAKKLRRILNRKAVVSTDW